MGPGDLDADGVAALDTLDFKGGISLIEAGYRHAADALSRSGLAERFVR